MSLVTRFAMALIHDMAEPELTQWASGLSGRAGEELRDILRSSPPDAGAEGIAAWLQDHHDEAAGLLPLLLKRSAGRDVADDTVISDYLAVLNGIANGALCCGRPLVLRGFFHCSDCLTYWCCHSEHLESLHKLERDASGSLIRCGGTRPRIFILEGPATNDRVWELNLEIRKSCLHRLDRSLYVGRPEVHMVREFCVQFTPGDPEAEIPPGAPGIIEMMASLPVALDAQRMPKSEVDKIVAAATARGARE